MSPSISEHKIEFLIAQLLRVGVIASTSLVAFGILIVLVSGETGYAPLGANMGDALVYSPVPAYPNSFREVVRGAGEFKPYAIIVLGLLILIATPVLRVAVSILAFARERDRVYLAITLVVFATLMLSFWLAQAGE